MPQIFLSLLDMKDLWNIWPIPEASAAAGFHLFRTLAPALAAGLFAPKVSSSPLVLPVPESSLLNADWMMALPSRPGPPSHPPGQSLNSSCRHRTSHFPALPTLPTLLPSSTRGQCRTAVTAPGCHLMPCAFGHANCPSLHPPNKRRWTFHPPNSSLQTSSSVAFP